LQLTGDDVLVVAPYNAQVSRLAERLRPLHVRAGTVDKFQGQQAPVVIYSMLRPWMTVLGLAQPMAPIVLGAHLGRGESEALSLAIETRAPRRLVDERAARRIAEALSVPGIGTLGVLLAAKRRRSCGHVILRAAQGVS
jgi:predicted nucleic acid-binding protein